MKKAFLIIGALSASFALSAQDASASADSLFNMLDEITVVSEVIDVAVARETPVAVSTISPSDIALKVGNLEFPEIMNTTPGVYATKQGGGYGDSRISLRGFDQKEFISVAELMQLFDISRATAQRLLKSGEVVHGKLGGKIIIPTRPLREKFGL